MPLLLLYPLYAGIMFGEQTRILFPAYSAERHAMRADPPSDGKVVEIPASFGNVRLVYRRPGHTSKAAAILYVHGNFECVEDSFALLQPLVDAGIPVLQLELPGFGGADGTPDFAAINEAGARAFDWLAAQPEVNARDIVVVGYSIGGGAAAELTRQRPAAALVLLSSYTSLADMAHRYLLPAFLLRYPYDNLARVRDFPGPVMIEHGRRDQVIPFTMGQRLSAARQDIDFVALNCGHDDCRFDETVFARRLPKWLIAHGLMPGS